MQFEYVMQAEDDRKERAATSGKDEAEDKRVEDPPAITGVRKNRLQCLLFYTVS